MDTDNLSIPTYNGILREAEKFNHDLTLQFGVLASICKDDDDYLNKAEIQIKNWLGVKNFNRIINSIFFGKPVYQTRFNKTLVMILSNITEIRKTPKDKREYENLG